MYGAGWMILEASNRAGGIILYHKKERLPREKETLYKMGKERLGNESVRSCRERFFLDIAPIIRRNDQNRNLVTHNLTNLTGGICLKYTFRNHWKDGEKYT